MKSLFPDDDDGKDGKFGNDNAKRQHGSTHDHVTNYTCYTTDSTGGSSGTRCTINQDDKGHHCHNDNNQQTVLLGRRSDDTLNEDWRNKLSKKEEEVDKDHIHQQTLPQVSSSKQGGIIDEDVARNRWDGDPEPCKQTITTHDHDEDSPDRDDDDDDDDGLSRRKVVESNTTTATTTTNHGTITKTYRSIERNTSTTPAVNYSELTRRNDPFPVTSTTTTTTTATATGRSHEEIIPTHPVHIAVVEAQLVDVTKELEREALVLALENQLKPTSILVTPNVVLLDETLSQCEEEVEEVQEVEHRNHPPVTNHHGWEEPLYDSANANTHRNRFIIPLIRCRSVGGAVLVIVVLIIMITTVVVTIVLVQRQQEDSDDHNGSSSGTYNRSPSFPNSTTPYWYVGCVGMFLSIPCQHGMACHSNQTISYIRSFHPLTHLNRSYALC